jgi:cell division protein FtsL
MVTIDQDLWNLLFGWLGPECMLPEGCTVPLTLVVVAVAAALAILLAFYKRRQLIEKADILIGRLAEKL